MSSPRPVLHDIGSRPRPRWRNVVWPFLKEEPDLDRRATASHSEKLWLT